MKILLVLFITLICAVTSWGAKAGGDTGMLNVKDFGAVGDGKTDDTAAFQKALDDAGKANGGIVFAPAGKYLIKTHLSIPEGTTLRGVSETTPGRSQEQGTILLAVEGQGKEDGEPFITLHSDSTLMGVSIFYPDQSMTNPVPYPWCVRGIGDQCTIKQVCLINPWQGVDFGTFPAIRHYVNGLYMQAIRRGVFVDKCFDIGRLENIHIWPFWEAWSSKELKAFIEQNGEAFIFGRTDWEYVTNCFCIGYKVGYKFTAFKDGSGNAMLMQCGSDMGPCAVLVESIQVFAGVSFSNSQFMAGVEVRPTNTGPVKFMNCGFWRSGRVDQHALLEGTGQTTFTACHFYLIPGDRVPPDTADIIAKAGGLNVNNCDFMSDRKQIRLEKSVKSAVIMGNRFRGGIKVENLSEGSVQIGLNTTE